MATWNSRGLRGSTLEEFIQPYQRKIFRKRTGFDPESPDSNHSH